MKQILKKSQISKVKYKLLQFKGHKRNFKRKINLHKILKNKAAMRLLKGTSMMKIRKSNCFNKNLRMLNLTRPRKSPNINLAAQTIIKLMKSKKI